MPSAIAPDWSARDDHADDRPTLAELARDEAAPADRPLTRHGHCLVGRLRYEPVDHLAFDASTTMCGQPFETTLVRVGAKVQRVLCDECSRAVDRG